MKVGYVRVSTTEQNPARQDELMKSYGVEKVYSEKLSGKDTNRPQFKEMLSFLREGDTLYVESFSRLSRSTRDLIDTVTSLGERGVNLVSDKEKIDTTTPQGRLVMTVFAAIYQFERENTLERQAEGIAIAKREGKYKGRKPIPVTNQFIQIATRWANGDIALKDAIAESGMSESTFFRKCKQYGISKARSSKSSSKSDFA